jgi:GNAT superfamily N-acetyltransferase
MSYIATILTSEHDRSIFSCGKEPLDNYIQKQATQDMKKKLAVVFVIAELNNNRVKGFYTLSNDSVPRDIAPPEIQKKIPQAYTNLPVTLLGRLAVDQNYRKQGLGEHLLLDALKRSYDLSKTSIGSIAVVVDPIDVEATAFYAKYGFIILPDSGRLFLPMKTIGALF